MSSSIRFLAAALAATVVSAALTAPDVSSQLQSILNKAHQGDYTYPTSLTQGIIPKGIHSHNDYWRDVPVYTALSAGCISIEADVFLINGTLYIGHEEGALSAGRTFDSLYINPLVDILKAQNPSSPFVTQPSSNGVFDTNSGQTLYLFVDVKTDGLQTWPAVVKALEPLRAQGWLSNVAGSSVNSTTFTSKAVTVIGTGNTPLSLVQPVANRDYFWDAPTTNLNTSAADITSLISPIASTDFAGSFGDVRGTSFTSSQLDTLRAQVATAHAKGIMLRYWNQPGWPTATRNGIWRTLYNEGVDLVNADDVIAAAGFSDEGGNW